MHTIEIKTRLFKGTESSYPALNQLALKSKYGQLSLGRPKAISLEERDHQIFLFNGAHAIDGHSFFMRIDFLEILQKENVESAADIAVVKAAANNYLATTGMTVDDFSLSEIDYCCNIRINSSMRKILVRLYNQMPENASYMKRCGILKDGTYSFETDFYYRNNSNTTQFYDKEAEIEVKGYPLRPYEESIMRFERQMRPTSLKNQARVFKSPKTFDYWVNLDREAFYLQKACKIFPQSDFRSLAEAEKIIEQSKNTKLMKAKLMQYLRDISAVGSMNKVIKPGRTKQTINNYIHRLANLNINPVTLDTSCDLDYLRNPLKWE